MQWKFRLYKIVKANFFVKTKIAALQRNLWHAGNDSPLSNDLKIIEFKVLSFLDFESYMYLYETSQFS